jgi:serine/threonine-protein kinase
VLPFRNLTGAPDAAFYEFSLADGVITELAHLKSLVVRPSVYVAPYVGQVTDPRQVGEDLAAELVLTGAFIKAEGRIRVTVQLLNTASGDIVWSDKLDVANEDLLTIQDEIAEHLIAGLKLRLTPEEQQQIDRPMTRSTDAYEYYLRARDMLYRYIQQTHDEADLEATIKMLHEAIGLDPEFARAHATLGRCYVMHAQGWGGAENYMLAERSLKRALELDPTIVNSHLQMVYVDLHHGDKQHARDTMDRLLREAPEDPSVLFVAGMLYRLDGLYERALEMYNRALELNPKDLVVVSVNRARIRTHEGRFAEAIADLEAGRAMEPEHPLIKTFLAVVYFNQGRVDDAQALIEDVLRQNPHFDGVQPLLAWCLSARGEHEAARALITERVKEVATADHDIAFWLASFYGMEGMKEEAIEWVRLAIWLGNENYPLFAQSRKLDSLRDDARFVEMMEDLKRRYESRREERQEAAP